MVVIAEQSQLHSISHLGIQHLVEIRLQQLGSDAFTSTEFIIVEPGDATVAIEKAAGFPILTSLFDDHSFGQPDFYPCYELLEEYHYEHYRIYEMVFIGNDDGFATTVIVPATEGIPADLLAMCRSFATPAVTCG